MARPAHSWGGGNFWIEDTYTEKTQTVARFLIRQAIEGTAPNQLKILGYDEGLSGLFAPFAKLTEGESRVIELVEEFDELKRQLEYLKHEVRQVQNVIGGQHPSLYDYRAAIGRPVERYQLVVLSMRVPHHMEHDAAFAETVQCLLLRGPAAGVSFVIISDPLPEDDRRRRQFERLAPPFHPGDSNNAGIIRELEPYVSARSLIGFCDERLRDIRENGTKNLDTVEFLEVHRGPRWAKESRDGLDITIGLYGTDPQTFTIGDEVNQRHNVLITGAVGQGKSNLISDIIHSLCWSYSPDEVELYLLDFKEGVTFKPYTNVSREEYLPHARAVGLESDVEFGIAVLEELHGVYLQRMRLLKKYNVRSLRELRLVPQGERDPQDRLDHLPRIVVIIDEFQLMFGDSIQAQQVVGLLEQSVRLYRAAGIHIILSSQTLENNLQLANRQDAIFGQIPVRIALKNTLAESHRTLGMENPAAAYLRPREAILNEDYGNVSQNKKVSVAFADERVLQPMRDEFWAAARDTHPAPYVYDSERRARIADDLATLAKAGEPTAALGQRISVSGALMTLPLPDDPGRNIAVIGAQDADGRLAEGVMHGVALSLALTSAPARFIFCEFKAANSSHGMRSPELFEALRTLGHRVEDVDRADFEGTLQGLLEEPDGPVYVFATNLDNLPVPQGFGENPLMDFASQGPSHGKHLIGWWVRAATFLESTSAGTMGSDPFNTKVVLRAGDVQFIIGAGEQWVSQSNRGLVVDRTELEENIAFVPYVPVGAAELAAARTLASEKGVA